MGIPLTLFFILPTKTLHSENLTTLHKKLHKPKLFTLINSQIAIHVAHTNFKLDIQHGLEINVGYIELTWPSLI